MESLNRSVITIEISTLERENFALFGPSVVRNSDGLVSKWQLCEQFMQFQQ